MIIFIDQKTQQFVNLYIMYNQIPYKLNNAVPRFYLDADRKIRIMFHDIVVLREVNLHFIFSGSLPTITKSLYNV